MEIEKSQVSDSSKSLNKNIYNDSIRSISTAEIEQLVNPKKLNKKSDKISTNNIIDENTVKSSSIQYKKDSSKQTSKKNIKEFSNSESDGCRQRKINKENKSESIYKEKSEWLFKLHNIIEKSKGKWNSKLTMDNLLEEIKNEYSRIKSASDNENMVKFCKHGLVMGIKGLEMLNYNFDPLGVDLDGWSEALSYNMETAEYDEVLSDLYQKYKSSVSVSPEMKLLFMITMSGATFAITKKMTTPTSDGNSLLSNLTRSFMGAKSQPQPQADHQQRQQPPARHQPQPQPRQQSQMQGEQPQIQNSYMVPGYSPLLHQTIPSPTQLNRERDSISDDSDNIPSKIRGPATSFDTPDSINIENIIKTMQNRKNIQQNLDEESESNELKNVKIAKKAQPRGRPKKIKTT